MTKKEMTFDEYEAFLKKLGETQPKVSYERRQKAIDEYIKTFGEEPPGTYEIALVYLDPDKYADLMEECLKANKTFEELHPNAIKLDKDILY